AMATNGTLVDAQIARKIADAGFRRVSISIDGADAATHDAFRNQVGAFDAALAGAKHLQDVDIPVQFNATVTTHNVDQLDSLYRFVIDKGAVALHLFLLVPVGCGVEIAETQQISSERYEQVLQWVCDRQLENEIELRVTCGPHYYRVAAQRGIPAQRGRGCLCGISVVFVSHRGEVFPCGYFPLDCGNVRTTPLDEIWRTNEHFSSLRDYDLLEGQCGRCGWKKTCGGCRARAYAATGNYLSEEPFCVLTDNKGNAK
ncbi:MAG: SPASM domain-containing protein, partial [Phycisphaerales bacterium]|nr:SPASM domain-containing protein [Phycisphaerales bacterium]